MHIRTDFWRFTIFTALGLAGTACNTTGSAPECGGSEPVSKKGPGSDLSVCKSGLEHRPSNQVTCTSELPRKVDTESAVQNESAGGGADASNLDGGARADERSGDEPGGDGGAGGEVTREDGGASVEAAINDGGVAFNEASEAGASSGNDPWLGGGECESDSECTEKDHGYCTNVSQQPAPLYLACVYGCTTDSDCDDGQVCSCGSPVGRCVETNCTQDSDCGPGLLCGVAFIKESCSGRNEYRCQHPHDECSVSRDCPSERPVCHFDGSRRVCGELGAVCGRPFLVEGAALLAPLSELPFGAPEAALNVACLDATTRETLGRYWAEVGLMEHASIAAFARFALQLMHVGAPLSLLEAAQRAMVDETEHAKACFGIAAQLFGRGVGAGKLPMDNALTETSLADIVRLTVREGCIGETVAAIEAAEACAATREPHIRAVLSKIQTDELKHSELAWRFVQWALTQEADAVGYGIAGAQSLRDVVRQEIAAAVAALGSDDAAVVSADERVGATYGVLPAATRAAVRRSALEGVVVPCAAELLRGFEVGGVSRDAQHLAGPNPQSNQMRLPRLVEFHS